jgi:hypothetical protein
LALAVVAGVAALAHPALAQPGLGKAPQWLQVAGGLGGSFTLVDGANGTGSGGYVAVELLSPTYEWATGSLYSGVLLTRPEGDCGPGVFPCDLSAGIFFLGAKGRLVAPIPWVAPFFELGVGISIGRTTTLNGAVVEAEAKGFIPHWLWGLGLALGPHNEFSLSLQYLEHTRGQQS